MPNGKKGNTPLRKKAHRDAPPKICEFDCFWFRFTPPARSPIRLTATYSSIVFTCFSPIDWSCNRFLLERFLSLADRSDQVEKLPAFTSGCTISLRNLQFEVWIF